MKVILLTDVPNVGKKNDIVEVNDGYAKNFLIKKKFAAIYSQGTIEKLNKELEVQKINYEQEVYQADLIKLELEKREYTFYLKANRGNAFGNISAKELLDEINKENKLVNKYALIKEHQWGLGNHFVELQIHKDVIARIKIHVLEQK